MSEVNDGGIDEFGMPTSDANESANQPAFDDFGMPTSDESAPTVPTSDTGGGSDEFGMPTSDAGTPDWGTNEDAMSGGFDEFGMPAPDTETTPGYIGPGGSDGTDLGADMGGE